MTREFVIMPEFERKWKQMRLGDRELRRLERILLADPKLGDVMTETGGLRKLRFPFEGKGKSGSARVVYVDFTYFGKIYLITAYTKNEKDNLSDEEKKNVRRLITLLENELRGE